MRGLLLIFVLLNFTAAVVVVGMSDHAVARHKMRVFSKYKDLEVNGIIDRVALAIEPRLAGDDWTIIPRWFNEGEDDWIAFARIIASVCGANGVLFSTLWYKAKASGIKPVEPRTRSVTSG